MAVFFAVASATGCHRARAAAGAEAGAPIEPALAGSLTAPDAAPSVAAAPPAMTATPFGPPVPFGRYTCPSVRRGGSFQAYLAAADTEVAFVDGDDWLALVNRSPTGALPPAYAPRDLVDVKDGRPRSASECEASHDCLRREAAAAIHRMLDAMHAEGMEGHVQSAFRGFGTQCWVFASWAHQASGGFCEATEQSALPGHSQHQLGTTLDLFTSDWAAIGAKTGEGVFRNGFGCTRGGTWLDQNAWHFGFVVAYPIDPDDRRDGSRCLARSDHPVPIDPKTGYKNEPWHLRFIGDGAAARYHAAWLASGPGTPDEITLEQWLRQDRGLVGDAELPVCDGCQCGACATLAGDDARTPCGPASLRLGADGRVIAPDEDPHWLDTRVVAGPLGIVIELTVHVPAHTPTQPPVVGPNGPAYGNGSTFMALTPYALTAAHRYPDLPRAWRVAIEPNPPGSVRWPWRVSLASPDLASTWNRANLLLPGRFGDVHMRIPIATKGAAIEQLRVTLLRDGVEHETRSMAMPPP